jgi:peptide/nickel transport system substrate-binding protein
MNFLPALSSAKRSRRSLTVAASVAALGLVASACGGPASNSNQSAAPTTATYGYISTGPTTDYTFPMSLDSQFNETFQYQIYKPLYWFGGKTNGLPLFNENLSIAKPPVYTDGGKTVTVRLKHYLWSDGSAVTSRDVIFFMNMVKAEKLKWPAYVPGFFPDNVVSTTAPNSATVVFHLKTSYGTNSQWFLYNELSQITPFPQQVWDRTSAGGRIGNYDSNPAGAAKVWAFLEAQTVNVSTYDTNPLWRVVDGPWKLESFTTDGRITLVPNRLYSGPDKPKLKQFQELPFASDTAELNDILASKTVTLGTIPFVDARPEAAALKAAGYKISTVEPWAINYIPINFHNATFGPIISQLYVRQAMESLVDQTAYIRSAFSGFATPTYGPVPVLAHNVFAGSSEDRNPYPYDPAKAVSLLSAHGWTVHPAGVTTCTRAGRGPNECGANIPAGARMAFTLEYAVGSTARLNELQFIAGDFAKAGIRLTLKPTNSLNYNQCTPKQAACAWQLVQGGTSWTYYPDYYPTGGEILSTGAVGNPGSYSNPTVDDLVTRARSGNLAALHHLASYVARQLPDLWIPVPDTVVVYKANLRGVVPEDSLGNIFPSTWNFER